MEKLVFLHQSRAHSSETHKMETLKNNGKFLTQWSISRPELHKQKMSCLTGIFAFQMLVVFKSAPILKRALKVKHELLQLYVLKVSPATFPFKTLFFICIYLLYILVFLVAVSIFCAKADYEFRREKGKYQFSLPHLPCCSIAFLRDSATQ